MVVKSGLNNTIISGTNDELDKKTKQETSPQIINTCTHNIKFYSNIGEETGSQNSLR